MGWRREGDTINQCSYTKGQVEPADLLASMSVDAKFAGSEECIIEHKQHS